MSKFPLWKYLIILAAVVVGFLYTLPNFYGEVPAVQISGIRSSVVVGADTISQISSSLKADGIQPTGEVLMAKL